MMPFISVHLPDEADTVALFYTLFYGISGAVLHARCHIELNSLFLAVIPVIYIMVAYQ